LPPELHERRPIPITLPPDTAWRDHNAVWLVDRKVRSSAATPTTMDHAKKKSVSLPSQELTDVSARLADLDRYGIEKQVIYPSSWLACMAEDAELEAALARSYNTFMARQCNASGGRLFYGAVIPFRRPELAIQEIRRVRRWVAP